MLTLTVIPYLCFPSIPGVLKPTGFLPYFVGGTFALQRQQYLCCTLEQK